MSALSLFDRRGVNGRPTFEVVSLVSGKSLFLRFGRGG